MNIAVTGYWATGSSAMLDYLSEYQSVKIVPERHPYEHLVFCYPNGLFDLFAKLKYGNTPQGSDIYINDFISSMRRLNDYEYVWYGSYKALFEDKFMNIVYSFVDAIAEKQNKRLTSYHNLRTRFSIRKAILQLAAKYYYHRNIKKLGLQYVKDDNPVYFSMPTEEELLKAVKSFTKSYFCLFESNDTPVSVFDHLIWPGQIDEMMSCFDDNLKVLILNRDPRDIFMLSKYILCKPPIGTGNPNYSPDPELFAEEWKRIVKKSFSNPNVFQIYFEDLVYNYDAIVSKIESFVGLSPSHHIEKQEVFNPLHSIENTQIWLLKDEWKKEAAIIAKLLPDYLYDFPFERIPVRNKMFMTVKY